MPSFCKNLRHGLLGGKTASVDVTTRNEFPLRQCPGCGLYARNDPTKCRQCTDVEFLRRSAFVVHDLNEDFTKSRDEATDLLSQFLDEGRQKKEAFVDKTFPLNAASVFYDVSKSQDVHWCRLFNNQRTIYGDACTSLQIIRTECFDRRSWVLDAISLVSERPDVLHRIFLNEAACPEGAYVLRLCKNGQWMPVIVDDSVPVDSNQQAIHSKTSDGQLWVPLIEKAAAKICGSYEALTVGGDVCDGLEMLTGAPTESNWLVTYRVKDELWKELLHNYKNEFLVIATSGDLSVETNSVEEGSKGHCQVLSRQNYGVLKVLEDGLERKLLLHPSPDDEDQKPPFYVTYTDFIQYFDVMHVCRVRSDWTEVRVAGTLPTQCRLTSDDVPIRRLTITEKTSLDVTVYQNSQNEKLLTDLCIVIFTERSGHDIENRVNFADVVCQSPRTTQGSVSLQCKLNPGSYLIACMSINSFLYDCGDSVEFVMAVRSPTPLLPMRRLQFTRCAVTDAFIRLAMLKGVAPLPAVLSPGVNAYAYERKWHGLIMLVENTVRDKFAVVTFVCPLRDKVAATRSSTPTKDYVPPGCRKIVAFLTEKEWNRLHGEFSVMRFITASTINSKDPSEEESTPKFNDRVKELHVSRPMWLT